MTTKLSAALMLAAVLPHAGESPEFGKKVYVYLMRVSPKASAPVTYLQKRASETVTGKAEPGELIVVQIKGEYHVVKPGLHAVEAAMTLEGAQAKGKCTSQEFVDAAVADILQANPHIVAGDLEMIGWCASKNAVRACRMPQGYGDVVIVKSWGEQPANSETHVIVFTDGDAYFNLSDNLRTEWFPLDDLNGEPNIATLPVLTKDELDSAIDANAVSAAA